MALAGSARPRRSPGHRSDPPASRAQPDIVALKKDGTLLIIEAKRTGSRNRPLTLSKVQSRVGGKVLVQPSQEWLARRAQTRYLANLRRSSRPRDRDAARRLERVIAGEQFDAGIVYVRPSGGKAYGRGVDTTARLIRRSGGVRRLDIIDVPFR